MNNKERIVSKQTGSELKNVLRKIGQHEKKGEVVPTVLFDRRLALEQQLQKMRKFTA